MKTAVCDDGSGIHGIDTVTALLRSEHSPYLVVDDPDMESLFPEIEDDPFLGIHSGRRIFTEVGEIPAYDYFGEPDDEGFEEIGFAAEEDGNGLPEKYTVMLNRMPVTVTSFPADEEEVAKMRRESERKIYDEQNSKLVANGHDPLLLFDENGYKTGRSPLSMVGQKRFSVKIGKMSKESYDRFLTLTAGPYVRKRFTFAKVNTK